MSLVSCLLSLVSCLLSLVSCLLSLVSCLLSLVVSCCLLLSLVVSCCLLLSLVSCLLSLCSFLSSLVSFLFSLFSFLFSLFSCLLSLVSCLLSLFSFLFSLFSFLFSLVSCLLSLVSCLLSLVSCLFSLFSFCHDPESRARAPPFVLWPLCLLAGYTAFVSASARPVSITHVGPHLTLSAAAPRVPVPPLWELAISRGPCWSWTTPKAHAYHHTHDTFWATQTTWAWLPPKCRQRSRASSNSSLYCAMKIQVQLARTPPRLLQRLVDDFMRSSYKKAVSTCSKSRTSSLRTPATRTSPSCSTGTHWSPSLRSSPFTKLRQARTHGAWQFLWFEDFCDALPFRSPPRSHFALNTHNVVAKKRGCSTDLLRRLRGYMEQHNVDFIGGDPQLVMCHRTQNF